MDEAGTAYRLGEVGELARRSAATRTRRYFRLCREVALPVASLETSPPLAIQMRHLGLGIPRAGSCSLGHGPFQGSNFVRRECHREGAQRFCQPVAPSRADERYDVVAAGQHPRDGNLRNRHALRARYASALNETQVVARGSRLGSAG